MSITASGTGARTAGARASARITASGASARTAGAPPFASITAEGADVRTAGARASASITARGADARTAGARASASITAAKRSARTAGARASASITAARTGANHQYLYRELNQEECGGSGICAHYRQRNKCKDCKRRRAELAARCTGAATDLNRPRANSASETSPRASLAGEALRRPGRQHLVPPDPDTDINLVKLEWFTREALAQSKTVYRIDVDFTNAFNAMSQTALWQVMEAYGIPDVDC